jgi:hypothetical protein
LLLRGGASDRQRGAARRPHSFNSDSGGESMSAHQAMEHSEHIQHADHEHEHEHGDAHGKEAAKNRLGTYVGITMAILGVMLAFCSAKVGGERTELTQTLVEQSNAQAQYHAQDVKHRVAFIALQQVHATAFGAGGIQPNRADVLTMATTVERYLEESRLAEEWSESYDPAVEMHVEASERYEWAQLFAEIGIVVASVALLIKRRSAWFLSLILGACAVATVARTYAHGRSVIVPAAARIHHLDHDYHAARVRDRTTAQETALVEGIREWAQHASSAGESGRGVAPVGASGRAPNPSEPAPGAAPEAALSAHAAERGPAH